MKNKIFRASFALVIYFGVFNFISCEKEEDFSLLSETNVSLYKDKTSQIKFSGDASFSVENNFIASVDAKGLITAEHIGETWIIINGQKLIKVTVKPSYTSIKEPVLKFGATKAEIKSLHGGTPTVDNTNGLGYTATGKVNAYVYTFENGKMQYATMRLAYSELTYLTNFLLERYAPIDVSSSSYLAAFVNGYKEEKITTLVSLQYYNGLLVVLYAPYSPTKAAPQWQFDLGNYSNVK